jgi:hypothetical protein
MKHRSPSSDSRDIDWTDHKTIKYSTYAIVVGNYPSIVVQATNERTFISVIYNEIYENISSYRNNNYVDYNKLILMKVHKNVP